MSRVIVLGVVGAHLIACGCSKPSNPATTESGQATTRTKPDLKAEVPADDAENRAVEFFKKFGNGVIEPDLLRPGKPVTMVNLHATKVMDEDLKELAPIKNLTELKLGFTEVTDAGLKNLVGLKKLTRLDLTRTAVTDQGIKELAALKDLTHLDLALTEVTDAGVKELQSTLPKCKISK